MTRFYVRNYPHFLQPHLEAARRNKSAAVRNAASCALILLASAGRGRRPKAWLKDFERFCVLAECVR